MTTSKVKAVSRVNTVVETAQENEPQKSHQLQNLEEALHGQMLGPSLRKLRGVGVPPHRMHTVGYKGTQSKVRTVAEYFAGIGLVRMGLEAQGWRVVYANDISPKKYEMYQSFFPNANQHYVTRDIFDLDPLDIPNACLATCSFPCIDLSLAGNMSGINGAHSSAFWGFIKVLKGQGGKAPPLILVENVPGWLSSNKGSDFRVTVKALNELGYACDVFTLDALRFTPQSRLRVFLVGAKISALAQGTDVMLIRPRTLTSDVLRRSLLANRDLQWFGAAIPDPPHLLTGGLSQLIEPLDESDTKWWSDDEVRRHLKMMDDAHRRRVAAMIEGDTVEYRTFFRRRRRNQQRAEVRDDDLSGCLRTAVGGSGKQFLIKAGKGRVMMRAMTPREYARLQGVPETCDIKVNEVQALTGFGDAVCVPVIAWIAQNVLNPLVDAYMPKNPAK